MKVTPSYQMLHASWPKPSIKLGGKNDSVSVENFKDENYTKRRIE